ncbi:hypothetical protein NL676_035264 [Syzygium grande]|nr:hypothetical protein NL676_035264 [Syzygium grande]
METGGDSDPCNGGTEQAADLRANESHGAFIDPLPFAAKKDNSLWLLASIVAYAFTQKESRTRTASMGGIAWSVG